MGDRGSLRENLKKGNMLYRRRDLHKIGGIRNPLSTMPIVSCLTGNINLQIPHSNAILLSKHVSSKHVTQSLERRRKK